jgi:hypothetical protein
MLEPDQRGGAELMKPHRMALIETGHAVSVTRASVSVLYLDPKTGQPDRSVRERGQNYYATKSHAVASWINPAKTIANERAAEFFMAAVHEGRAEPMHGAFRAGMTARDIALVSGAARHPTPTEKTLAAEEHAADRAATQEPENGKRWLEEIRTSLGEKLSEKFRVTSRRGADAQMAY